MRQLKIVPSITVRTSKGIEVYFSEVAKTSLIDIDEEVELAKRIREKDPIALKKLVISNLRFVVSVAKQYQNKGLSLEDLIEEGNLGLIKAATRFDETRGFKFISYAVWWIRQSILDSINRNKGIVRLPLNKISERTKVRKFVEAYYTGCGEIPPVELVCEHLELSCEKYFEYVERLMSEKDGYTSLDRTLTEGESGNMYNVIANSDDPVDRPLLHAESLRKSLALALNTLTDKEAFVLRAIFGIGEGKKSLEDVGDMLSTTRERTRQIKEKALKALRTRSSSTILKEYL